MKLERHFKTNFRSPRSLQLLGVLTGLLVGFGVPSVTFADITFPAAPEQWINSRPVSAEAVKDKVVLLWFYEEG